MKLLKRFKKKPKLNPLYRSSELANESVRAAFYEMARHFKMQGDLGRDWASIFEAYNGPLRFYHNMNHIYEMLLFLDKHAKKYLNDDDYYLLVLCVIYHDYYYKVDDPEIKSAFAAVVFYYTHIVNDKNEYATFINDTIRATINHESSDWRTQWLIDADLYRLREPAKVWTPAIRMEYAEHPDDKFNDGRKAVLKKFLERKPFFYHLPETENLVVYYNLTQQIAE